MAVADPILECSGLGKSYGGLAAVSDVSFAVRRGEVYGIAGPNGAGKTTLFNLLTGHVPSDRGTVIFDGAEITRVAAHDRFRLGLARTFQVPLAFEAETVLTNAALAARFGRHGKVSLRRFSADDLDRAHAALETAGLTSVADEQAGRLDILSVKKLMVASALAASPKVLLLDEPFGGLTEADTAELQELIARINADHGVSVVIIEHVLHALFALSNTLLVLHHGTRIFEGRSSDALQDEAVVSSYLGATVAARLKAAV